MKQYLNTTTFNNVNKTFNNATFALNNATFAFNNPTFAFNNFGINATRNYSKMAPAPRVLKIKNLVKQGYSFNQSRDIVNNNVNKTFNSNPTFAFNNPTFGFNKVGFIHTSVFARERSNSYKIGSFRNYNKILVYSSTRYYVSSPEGGGNEVIRFNNNIALI